MAQLNGFPLLSQLSDTNEVNRQFDCVPTCIAAALQFLLGKPFDAAAIKDAIYGKDYTGGTDAANYVAYCAQEGVKLFSQEGDAAQLVALAHENLAQGRPTLLTIADPYVPASYGWTHAMVAYEESSGELTCLDPYIGKGVTHSDAEWASLLRTTLNWVLEKSMNLPSNWHLSDDGQTLYCKSHIPGQPDIPVVFGFKDYVLPRLQSGEWLNEDVFLGPQGYQAQLEYSNPDLGDGDQILSLFGRMLCYPHNPKGVFASLKQKVILEYTGVELQRWKSQMARLLELYQADEAKLAAPQSPAPVVESAQVSDLQQRLSVISGLVNQATPILQHIGTAATVAK